MSTISNNSSDSPMVSVLMTAYNREQFISEAIESVLKSSFTDFELIIVDDGSHDDTVSIARKYEEKDSRVMVFVNEKNLGDYPNRNRAASLARGRYIKYVDSDDRIYKSTLEIMVNAMQDHPAAGIAMGSRPNDEVTSFPTVLDPPAAYRQHFFVDGFLDNGPLAVMIRRDVFESTGGFSGKRMVGDVELWLKICARYPIIRLQKGLVFWRQHDGQEYQQGFLFYLLDGSGIIVSAMRDPHCPLSVEEKEKVISIRRNHSRHQLYRFLFKSGNLRKFLQLNRSLKQIFSPDDYVASS